MKPLTGILLLLCICTLPSEGRTGKRVSAWARHSLIKGFPLSLQDSTVFMYSGGRGSIFDYSELRYCFTDYRYPSIWGNLFDYQYRLSGEIGVQQLWVQSDSNINYYYSRADQQMHRGVSYRYDYAGDGSLLSLGQTNPTGSFDWQMVAAYDTAGHCSRMYYINLLNSSPDTNFVRYLFHNSAGQLVRDSTFTDKPLSGRAADDVGYFSYAGTQCTKIERRLWDADAGAYRPDYEAQLSYYPGGKTKRILRWSTTFGAPTTMIYAGKDSFGYTPGMQTPSFYLTWGLFNNMSSPANGYVVNQFNPAGYPDSVTMYTNDWNLLYPFEGRKVYYDTDHATPLRVDYSFLDPTAPYISLRDIFHYEPYEMEVPVVPAAPLPMTIVPNPSTGRVILLLPSNASDTRVLIAVTNVAGRLVHAKSTLLQGTKHELVLSDDIPPGMYIVTVQNTAGQTICTGRMARQ